MTSDLAAKARHAMTLADELLPFFADPLGALIREEIGDGTTDVLDMTAEEYKEALHFLMLPPHMRGELVADLSPTAARLALRARYIGLTIAKTLFVAVKCSQIDDRHLSVSYAGQLIQQHPTEPTLAEILNYKGKV